MIKKRTVYMHNSRPSKLDLKRNLKDIFKKKSVDKIPSVCVSRKCFAKCFYSFWEQRLGCHFHVSVNYFFCKLASVFFTWKHCYQQFSWWFFCYIAYYMGYRKLNTEHCWLHLQLYDTTRCYFNVRSKADTSQLNLPHGNRQLKSVKQKN